MITFEEIPNETGEKTSLSLPFHMERRVSGNNLLLLPAMIDPHVHFRTPGQEDKENWVSGAKAAISGGVCHVFDMPNNTPSIVTYKALLEKKRIIEEQLEEADIPLGYHLYIGASKHSLNEIEKSSKEVVGIKVFLGSSTGDLLMDCDKALLETFRIAKKHDLMLSFHAECEKTLQELKQKRPPSSNPFEHTLVRDRIAAIHALKKILSFQRIIDAKVMILHVSTKEEMSLIKEAKKEGLPLFCETCPHHLFLDEEAISQFGCHAQVNPPLRTKQDQEALFEAIDEGVVDVIGSDHAPHTEEEKKLPYGKAPSGIAHIEYTLPLLIDAFQKKKLSLKTLVHLTSKSARELFKLPQKDDFVIIDREKERRVSKKESASKGAKTPFEGRVLKGWPIYTILGGRCYDLEK